MDVHIIPLLFLTYLLAFLDRSNIGNAKVAGMNEDLRIDDEQYRWLLTIFYISYIVFQFLLICYKFVRPSLFMGTCVFVWGLAAILQAASFDWQGMMAARFFIGMAEAGYGTGVALYLNFFYPRQEIGVRFAWFVVGSAVASAIAGSVAYGIQGASIAIANWRLIFIVEAAPTVILSVFLFFLLPDSIASARFLTPHERLVAEARLYRTTIDKVSDGTSSGADDILSSEKRSKLRKVGDAFHNHFNLRNGLDALRDPISYINAVLLFIINVGFASIPVYLPTILSHMGYTRLRSQAFSAPPYAAAFVLAVIVSYLADKFQTRGIIMSIMTAVGIVGYFMLATIEDDHTRYGGVWLVVIGLFTFIPLCYMWLTTNSYGESKQGVGLVIFGTVGQCGPVLGTNLFPDSDAPYYKKGMYVSASLLVGAFAIEWAAITYYFLVNQRQDKRMATKEQQQQHQQRPEDVIVDAAGQEKGLAVDGGAARPLQFASKLEVHTPEGRQELHNRRLDIAEHRERSIYFRYSL